MPDSLLPLHMAFLAHALAGKEAAAKTETSRSEASASDDVQETEEPVLDSARKVLKDLWRENGKDFDSELQTESQDDNDEEESAAKKAEQIVSQMTKEL